MKKIAILSPTFLPATGGGVASSHENLYYLLKKNKYGEIKVFTFNDNYKSKDNYIIRSGNIKILSKIISKLLKKIFYLIDRKDSYQLNDVIAKVKGSFIAGIKIRFYNPDILFVPDHGAPLFFIFPSKRTKVIWISHHNPMRFINNSLLGEYSIKDAKYTLKFENIALKRCNMVICPSNYMKNEFKNTYKFFGPICVLPNCIDIDLIDSIETEDVRKYLNLKKDALIYYIPSGGSKIKGEMYVSEIIQRITNHFGKKNVGFYISGNISEKLKKAFKSSKNIYMPNKVVQQKNISLKKSCNITISPTLVESFGMAILESVVIGIPVISFNTGGVSDIIKNGENGFIVKYSDIDDLIVKSIFYGENKNYFNKRDVRNYSILKFSGEKIFNDLKKFFRKLLTVFKYRVKLKGYVNNQR